MVEFTSRKHGKSLVFLFLGVVLLSFFTSHATLSIDPPNRYLVAKSIVDYGDLQIRLAPGEPIPPGCDPGLDGNNYSLFGIGQALIFAGPYAFYHHVLGIESDKMIRSLISVTVFPVNLALTALVFYFLLGAFKFSHRRAYLAAICLVFATGLWQLSKEGQEGAHLALLFALVGLGLRRFQVSGTLKWLAVSAVAMGYSFITRVDTAPMVLCYLVFVFYLIGQNRNKPEAQPSTKRAGWYAYLLVIGLTLPALLIHMYITNLHFGHLVAGKHNPFSVTFVPRGLMGLLFSPGRSVFLYNPIFLLAPVGFFALYRRHREWFFFIGAAFMGCLLLHAAVDAFHGNCCWGPRYLCRHFPLLFIPLAFFVFFPPQLSVMRRFVVILIAGCSILVQVLAVSLHHNRELQELATAYDVGWSDRQWTMFEPEANFLKLRVANLCSGIDEMVNGKIAPWPKTENHLLTNEEQLKAPTLHYLAFWPYHLTYYMPVVQPGYVVPLWGSTMILLLGVGISMILLIFGYVKSPR
ncbi:MAG: glycosyltransferase family 39 protein [Planctomycetes bacterium]|nr:glycosyltransferase family 39 protein [Planctomycetota bacterium]